MGSKFGDSKNLITTNIIEELKKFNEWPRLFQESGYQVETLSPVSFAIRPPKIAGDYNSKKKYQYFFSAVLHGNETGGLRVINDFCEYIINEKNQQFHSYVFCLGNIEAAKKNVRFIERDLNRSFLSPTQNTLEEKIATNISKIAVQAAFAIDLHQTNQESETPFFIFQYSADRMRWARFLHADIPSIVSGKPRHKDGSTLDHLCFENSTINVTLEMGLCGFYQEQVQFALQCLKKTLTRQIPLPNEIWTHVYKVIETIYWEKDQIVLNPGLYNFSRVKKDQVLGKVLNQDHKCPHTGVVLFPKYGEIAKNTKEVYTIASEIKEASEI